MKFSFIYLLSCICTLVAATGERGAAERAYIFSLYIQEEIYSNLRVQGAIATMCVGTRTGLLGQDADEFYRVARELSQWDMQSRLAISDRINAGTLTAAQEARFNNWRKESQYTLELFVGLREKNINREIIQAMACAENFGHAIRTQENTGYQHIRYIGAFPVPDREATITQYTDLFGGGNAGQKAAAAAYNKAINAIKADKKSRHHWLAIANWRHPRVRMAGCRFYR